MYLNIHSQMVGEHSLRAEAVPKGAVDFREERMPVYVTIIEVRILFAESPRLPEEGSSSQG